MQQRYSAKPEKIEVLYKQSMNGALQDVKTVVKSIIRKGQIEFLIKRSLTMRKEGYSLVTITFTY